MHLSRSVLFGSAAAVVGAGAVCYSFLQGPADAQADRSFEFTISDDRVVPATDFAAKVSVIGSAITSGGVDMPVTMSVRVGDASHDLFGSSLDPVYGNLNDHSAARHVIIDEVFTQGDAITLAARSWTVDGESNHLTARTDSPSDLVHVLRDGDAVPDIAGFDGQASAEAFLRPYLNDDGTVDLDADQVIYLFELGETDLSNPAADFQDLVVLITLGDTPDDLRRRDLADIAAYD